MSGAGNEAPSKIERIRQMSLSGMRPAAIAAALDTSENAVRVAMSKLRERGALPERRPGADGLRVQIEHDVFNALAKAGRCRRPPMTAAALAETLLTTIARDAMVDAVLDDGGRE